METGVNAVCLVEAPALVAMVNARIRYPRDVELGQDGFQRILDSGGIISIDSISEFMRSHELAFD